MADVQVLSASGTNVTSSSTTWVDVATIAAGSFTANAKYLILAQVVCTNASSANEVRMRLVYGGTPTEFTDSSVAEEIISGTTRTQASWMYTYTQPGTTNLVKIQISSSSTTTATAVHGNIIAINLDDVGSANYVEATEVTANYTTTAAFVDGTGTANLTVTANGTDRWLLLGNIIWTGVSATTQFEADLTYDGTEKVFLSEEGEDGATESRSRVLASVGVGAAGSRVARIRARHETNAHTVKSTRLIAINITQAFADSSSNYQDSSAVTNITEAAGWISVLSASKTPTATGNFVILSAQQIDYNTSTAVTPQMRMQHNNSGSYVSAPNYGDTAPGADTWDGTDDRTMILFDVVSLTSGASRTVRTETQMANTGTSDPIVHGAAIAMFSVAKPGASTQTITLGLLDGSPALYAPTIQPDQFVTLGLLDSGPALYAPTLTPKNLITLPLLGSDFRDDFEGGTLDQWSTVEQTNGAITVVSGSAYGGSAYGMHISEAANAAGGVYVRRSIPSTNYIHLKGRFRQPTDGGAGNNGSGFRVFAGATRVLDVYRQNSTKEMWLRTRKADTTFEYWPTTAKTTVADNTWYEWEIVAEYRGAGAVSPVKVWLDGVLYANVTVDLYSGAWDTVQIGAEHLNQYVDLDVDNVQFDPYGPQLFGPTLTRYNTLTVPLLDSGPALYEPTVAHAGGVTQGITLGLLDGAPTLYSPTLTLAPYPITLGVLDSGPALYQPTLTRYNTITLGLLDSGPALYQPTLTPKWSVTLGLLDSGPALYAPTLAVGPVTITLGLLDSGPALYQPTLALAPYPITLGLLDSGPALYQPTLTRYNTITLGLLDSGPALYAPSLAVGPVTISLPLLDGGPTLYQMVLSNNTIFLPLLDGVPELYAPTLMRDEFITLPLLDGSPALYQPTLTRYNTLTVPLLDGGPTLYAPTLTRYNTLTLPLLDGAPDLYAPVLVGLNAVILPLLDGSPALYAPVLVDAGITLWLPLLDGDPALYAPVLSMPADQRADILAQNILLQEFWPRKRKVRDPYTL